MNKGIHSFHIYSLYFAPRGRERLLLMGDQLSQRHLSFNDRLIGIVGDAGSGKSLIIRGMFPGLELANDDDGVDIRKIMQVRNELEKEYTNTTYHLDMRFQMAFTQMFEIVDFVKGALKHGRRVIIEHFDLLYPYLNINADIIIGIGEEIIVTRPNLFGPLPKDISEVVTLSLVYRKMAHTAEDLTIMILRDYYKIPLKVTNSDVRRGFVLNFTDQPVIDIYELEQKVKELIEAQLSVSYYDESHIKIGTDIIHCTGPRIHVHNTSEIINFRLIKEIKYDHTVGMYALVGTVGERSYEDSDLNKILKEEQ